MDLTWSPVQQQALQHKNSSLIVGPAGSGKTMLLLHKAAQLAAQGHPTALVVFAYRGLEHLKTVAQGHVPQLTAHIATGMLRANTLRDFAAAQLQTTKQPFTFATNNQMREILRATIAQQAFGGTLEEAEHIIRSAKGKARKMPENDRHFPLVQAYKQRLEALGMVDRHDIIRRHVLGMKDGTIPPLPVKHLLLDDVQDATELQLIWLQMHLGAGIHLTIAGNDDVTAFTRDGALGPEAINTVEDWPDITRFNLPATYRTPVGLMPAVTKVARQLRTRHTKGEESLNSAAGELRTESFATAAQEHAFLIATCSQLLAENKKVGIITRAQFPAAIITQVLRKAGLNPASYARLIWEDPTPQLILAVLYVLLGQGGNPHLQLVLMGFGIPATTASSLFQQGLQANGWMQAGCPLPDIGDVSPTTIAAAQKVRRAFNGAWQLWQAKTLGPREIFKAVVADLLPHLPETEQPHALLALDALLSLSGKLTDVLPRVMQETLPNMESPITVAPVREMRGHQFHTVILPYAGLGQWPQPPYLLLGPDQDHERRMFHLALTRSSHTLLLTRHTPEPTPYLSELHQSLKNSAKK